MHVPRRTLLLEFMSLLMEIRFDLLALKQLRIFSSQVFQESSEEKTEGRIVRYILYSKCYLAYDVMLTCYFLFIIALTYDMEKHCNTEIAAKVVRVSSNLNGTLFLPFTVKFIILLSIYYPL